VLVDADVVGAAAKLGRRELRRPPSSRSVSMMIWRWLRRYSGTPCTPKPLNPRQHAAVSVNEMK
jgi:hypothetical protein